MSPPQKRRGTPACPPLGHLALLTPPGRGGIAVIRCIGPGTETVLRVCFRPTTSPFPPAPGCLAYGHIVDADDRPVDEIILYRALRQCSGRGEQGRTPAAAEAYEVNCHGGPAAVQAVCRRLASLGLETIDADRLMELEGLPRLARDARRALRRTTTPAAARILLDQLSGALAGAVGRAIEESKAGRPTESRAVLDGLLAQWFTCGRYLADPPRIAIAGRPNAGKSALLNRLAGADRALTSPLPGTTRDTVETEAALEGVPVVLVDTAGLREAGAAVEREGIERARAELAQAAAVIYLVDATGPVAEEDEGTIASLGPRAIVAWSKIDAVKASAGGPRGPAQAGLAVSAVTGRGLGALAAEILRHLGWRQPSAGQAVPFTVEQVRTLGAAREAVLSGSAPKAEEILANLLR